jgi:hypothetical protein
MLNTLNQRRKKVFFGEKLLNSANKSCGRNIEAKI